MLDVKYVFGDDWEGIYINNVIVNQRQKITFNNGFNAICKYINEIESVDHIQFSVYSVDQDWLEVEDSFPKYFDKIPSKALEEL